MLKLNNHKQKNTAFKNYLSLVYTTKNFLQVYCPSSKYMSKESDELSIKCVMNILSKYGDLIQYSL